MLKYVAAVLILATGFCAAPPHPAPPRPAPQIDFEAERYAVYSVLLKEMGEDPDPKSLSIEDQTSKDFYSKEEWDQIKVDPAWQPALNDYQAKNSKPVEIEDKFSLPAKVMLLPHAEVNRFFEEGGGWWEAFYRKYPKATGFITLSNVGFNPEMNYALVDVGFHCGGLCGNGSLVLLVKKDGKWVIENNFLFWES